MSKELGERIQAAMGFLWEDGQVEGSHHRAWVIDQVARILLGDSYDMWVKAYRADEYEWDEGTPP